MQEIDVKASQRHVARVEYPDWQHTIESYLLEVRSRCSLVYSTFMYDF